MRLSETDRYCRSGRVGGGWAALLLALLLLPSLVLATEHQPPREGIQVANPGTDLWRAVRQRNFQEGMPGTAADGVSLLREMEQRKAAPIPPGRSQAASVQSATLINPYGDLWRKFRMEQLVKWGGYALGGMLLFVLLFYLVRGKVRIEEGASGQKLFRYNVNERMIHWFMASTFLFLALTGLILLFGRPYLLPWMGPELFSAIASASKEGHNLFGPLFILALLLVIVKFVRRNIYQKGDLTWLLRGGGIIGKKHVPSNFFNMGEKSMFWLLVITGTIIAASGLVLVFPVFGQGREWMAVSHVAHGIAALTMTTVIIGHIYIGSIGMEGAIEVMKTGYCDLNWARAHHDWWAEKCVKEGKVLTSEEVARAKGDVPAGPVAEELVTGEGRE